MTRRHPGSTESYSEHTRTHTFSLTWQTDHYSPWRMAFKALLNAKVVLSNFLCAYSTKKLPERASTENTATCTVNYRSTTCLGTSTICIRSIKSSLPFSLLLRHSRDKLPHALSHFQSVLQEMKSWVGPGNEAKLCV